MQPTKTRSPHRRNAEAADPPRRQRSGRTAIRASVQQFAKLRARIADDAETGGRGRAGAGNLIGRLRDSVMLAPRTPFNAQVGPRRSFAVASLPLDAVKQVARHFGASLNDVVLALCARPCAIICNDAKHCRRALDRRDAGIAAGEGRRRSQQSGVDGAMRAADRYRRSGRAFARDHCGDRPTQAPGGKFSRLDPDRFPRSGRADLGLGPEPAVGARCIAERLPPLANLAVSNVPGPPVPLYLAGAKFWHYFPVSIVTHGLGLNITVNSYAGWLEFGLIACKEIAPKLDRMASGLERALQA